MLLSMTGHGQVRHQSNGVTITVEVRTVNNRFFKLSLRLPEGYASWEPRIDALLRNHIRRGTVFVSLNVERQPAESEYRINLAALKSYRRQVAEWLGEPETQIPWQAFLALPGVANPLPGAAPDDDALWAQVEQALLVACDQVNTTRSLEGRAMAADLLENCRMIRSELAAIQQRAPRLVDNYREKLRERLNKYLAEFGVTVTAADVVREVGIFAEKVDICEEIVRMSSHLDRFESLLHSEEEGAGRKLEFVIQEMFREVNTMGAKANDAEIAHRVVDMKTYIERMREMVQNIE